MNTESTAMRPSLAETEGASAVSWAQSFYWSLRRELWENRSLYIGPLVAAAVFLFGFDVNAVILRHRIGSPVAGQLSGILLSRYESSAALIMGVALIVGIFYTLDALYGERRDRSILFWKSLPVSDLTAVLSKFAIPIVVLPLLSFAITFSTHFLMLAMTSVLWAGSGVKILTLWAHPSFARVSLTFLYHLLLVHGLWYAPFYGWLLLVSAWSPRAPFIWALLPPFVICGLEKITFNTSHVLAWLEDRLIGTGASMSPDTPSNDFLATLIPHHFFSNPGLWTGLLVAAAFLAAAVWLRRSRGPI